jgi:dihydroorotase
VPQGGLSIERLVIDQPSSRILIRDGHVIDPASGLDEPKDVYVADGRILALKRPPDGFTADRILDAGHCVVCPGFVDLRARLREPGLEHKATIASETRAAASGGITTLCCPPDTDPVVDTPAVVELIHRRAEAAGMARVVVLGALTQGLQGVRLTEMAALRQAGCVGVSNALHAVANTQVLRRAFEYAATQDLTVFLHAIDPWLSQEGCMHEGTVSTRLGLPGIPEAAETVAVARDLVLVEQTGVRAHFCQLSTARAVAMVRRAREQGLPVSADVSAHHLHLSELDVEGFNSQCHVRPPLRTESDREALRAGLAEGSLCAVCSDHQPHEPDAKEAPFCATEPGISGLETLLPLTLLLVEQGVLSLSEAIARLTSLPAMTLGIEAGSLTPGRLADICIFDPRPQWRLSADNLRSQGRNTPFLGWEFSGRVIHTLLGGAIVYSDRSRAGV